MAGFQVTLNGRFWVTPEAMSTNVKVELLVSNGFGNAADVAWICLQNRGFYTMLCQSVSRSQTCGAGPNDRDNWRARAGIGILHDG